MDQIIGVAITAAVGVVGILSTHLLARSQRRGEIERQRRDQQERYDFAVFEARSALYADFIAELRTLVVAIRLRLSVTGEYRKRWGRQLGRAAREAEDTLQDEKLVDLMGRFAEAVEADPLLGRKSAIDGEEGLPPAIEMMPTVRRLTELAARIGIVGGPDAAKTTRHAEQVALTTLLRLEALESRGLNKDLPLDDLESAIARVEEAAIYEVQLLPLGEKDSLADLRKSAGVTEP